MIDLVYLLGAINLAVGLYSVAKAIRYRGNLRRSLSRNAASSYQPSVALLVPCCGEEEGLTENLRALFRQDYLRLELVFIVESPSDAALPIIRTLMESETRTSKLVIAGSAARGGQKIHNLLAGLAEVNDAEVLAFADSDVRPSRDWLDGLVAPLQRQEVGVTTGYRFYIPAPGNFASLLRSVWNAGVLTILGNHDHNFAWGGSMAIRHEVFRKAGVAKNWLGALSDDYALTHCVRNAGYRVEFVPSCIVPTLGTAGVAEVLGWCHRQMAITRVYWPNLWRIGGASQILYCAFLLAGAFVSIIGNLLAFSMLVTVLVLSGLNGAVRTKTIQALGPEWEEALSHYLWSYTLLAPLTSFLTSYAFIRSGLSRRIEWRGKTYEMRSPRETIILQRAPAGTHSHPFVPDK